MIQETRLTVEDGRSWRIDHRDLDMTAEMSQASPTPSDLVPSLQTLDTS